MTGAALAVALAALGLRVWCQVILVRHGIVTPLQRATPTLPTLWAHVGPYRVVRHPIYLLNLVMFAAIGVAAFGVYGFVLALPALPYYEGRRIEEEALRGAA